MKQLFQNVSNGETSIAELPLPKCKYGHLLIQTRVSLISSGTERMLVDFGKSNYLDKARKQPEKVRMVLDKVKSDGLLPTIESVKSKLDEPMPMGYSNVGVVIEVGDGVAGFSVGDRVVSNGRHSEVVCVPQNLCALIPSNVEDDSAVFTVVGSIALQGIRLLEPTLGESVVVMGLGLIGLAAVQILRANGCRVLGLDFDEEKVNLARSYGAQGLVLGRDEDPLLTAQNFSRGRGIDAVLITASTDSNAPVHDAANMCRQRGRIVLVGVVGLDLQRNDFYEKEISFQVSCSYGPGRYDSFYEDQGNDYPVGFVRWTEQRNFEAVLDMLAEDALSVEDLKTARFKLDDAAAAYETLLTNRGALGVLIDYNFDNVNVDKTVTLSPAAATVNSAVASPAVVAVIGAGNHAGRTLMPAFQKTSATLRTIASSQGLTGAHYGKKFGFQRNTTNTAEIFDDESVNCVVIATQHDSHANFVVQSLNASKNVFVEKPLALTHDELDSVDDAYKGALGRGENPLVMVGFNRRYAPLVQKLKQTINSVEPMSIVYTCNAGHIPADSWVQDNKLGGGRIIGEACHFIDMARFLVGKPIVSFSVNSMKPAVGIDTQDTVTITLSFKGGSIATVNYFANGHRSYPKERLEVFQSGGIAVLDNYKAIRSYGVKGLRNQKKFKQDKGQTNCAQAFVDAINNGEPSPIPYDEVMEVSRLSVDIANKLRD